MLGVQRRERKAVFCVGGWGLMIELAHGGSIGLYLVDKGQDVPG